MKKILLRLVILLSVLGAAWGGYMVVKRLPERQQQVPTAKVLRGDVVIRAYTRGETARRPFGHAHGAQPVRHRAGDADRAAGGAGAR